MQRVLIVVPCYNEAQRLDVSAFESYLASNEQLGFVFVNDGSQDATLSVLRGMEQRWPGRVTALDQNPNQGKAEAVRVGMLHAIDRGAPYVGYFDADLATPLSALTSFERTLNEHPRIEIVLGSRVALLGRQIERNPLRHYLGRVFATAASLVLALPVYDTQCGAKLFRASPSIRKLFEVPFGSRWIFDVEWLARFQVAGGSVTSIYELPLDRWVDIGDSRVRSTDFVRAGAEIAQIYRQYQLPRHKRWLFDTLTAPFLRYVGAGGIGTAVHYGMLAAVVELLGASPAIGTMVGALFGACVNYVLNYHMTFASKASHRTTMPRFFAVALLSACVSGAGMWLATKQLGIHYLPAQLGCTLLVLLLGFALNRAWTFRTPTASAVAKTAAEVVVPSAAIKSEHQEIAES